MSPEELAWYIIWRITTLFEEKCVYVFHTTWNEKNTKTNEWLIMNGRFFVNLRNPKISLQLLFNSKTESLK